jgi:D-alanyl-D-alanine carboxypeptidase
MAPEHAVARNFYLVQAETVIGKRQMSVAVTFIRWLDSSGRPRHHAIDDALPALYQLAMCGSGNTPK